MTDHPATSEHTERMVDRSPVRADTCRLVVTTGDDKGQQHEVARAETVVGSAGDCHFRLRDVTVSRRHFRILRDSTGYRLEDLDSTNGTFLDNAKVKEAYLVPGSLIRAGEVYLRFEPIFEQGQLLPSENDQFGEMFGHSYRMREIFGVLEKVAPTEATLLMTGETGTGKSALARAIHAASGHRDAPFVVIDCGAIAPTLVESELFGHERGAFTGAVRQRAGALELAAGGTLFIDELTELSLHLQPKLLRALEEREFTRVGGSAAAKMRCRVIAASQKDLWQEVEAQRFRADLLYRLAVVTIHLPALRERREDIPLLVDHFFAEIGGAEKRTFADLHPDLQARLLAHEWPGNIRELRNTIERVALMYGTDPFVRAGVTAPPAAGGVTASEGTQFFAADLKLPFKQAKEDLLARFELAYVDRLLDRVGGSVTEAARQAGLDRKHIYNLLAKRKPPA